MSSYELLQSELCDLIEDDLISTPEYPILTLLNHDPVMRNLTKTIGLYVVYWFDVPLYVGKSIAELLVRLRNHRNKLSTIPDVLSLHEITCKAIRIPAIRLIASSEEILIKKLNPILNGTDFGSNSDPARDAVKNRPLRKCWEKL